jgi:hypothetical protein
MVKSYLITTQKLLFLVANKRLDLFHCLPEVENLNVVVFFIGSELKHPSNKIYELSLLMKHPKTL